ncbi:uncharacterized protein LOC120258367 [Dioscorea cayenensis subsp. rotundata]|uniref:Uncharacterized protein LOC120258367 n=1 Tax=Dioscorea cayennensis subsp. rotundata TaxID=55577 RepID=A0AB40B2X1_DIOCR|nr:uncharacterized protein LOC120258367 [Dioscorea cayenensis subsp. rotundata]
MLHVFKHQIQAARHPRSYNSLKLQYIWMIKLSQNIATNLPVSRSRALYTELYVPCPICSKKNKKYKQCNAHSFAREPTIDGLRSDGGKPSRPTGGDMLSKKPMKNNIGLRFGSRDSISIGNSSIVSP